MMKSKVLFIISIIVGVQMWSETAEHICRPNDHRGRAREKTVRFYDLDLKINLLAKESKVEGIATYQYEYYRTEIDTLFLDGIEMTVSKLLLNGRPNEYRVDSAGITVLLPKVKQNKNKLEIHYTAKPKRGMYFLNWNNPDPKAKKQIWTQGQGIDNRHWVPGFDDVANLLTTRLQITAPRQYPLVSNGDLISAKLNKDSTTKTWTYQMKKPHALYLLMIATGDYRVKKLKTKSNITLEQYYYPEYEADFEATYVNSVWMMEWFEKEIGIPYPWGKVYRNVPTQDFLYGAMENTTSTIFTDIYHTDRRGSLERGYQDVNAHELAHQWFGDLITERNPTHHWLHESFATHYSKWYMYHTYGQEKYDAIRKSERDNTLNAAKNNSLPVAHSQAGSARHYPKGSLVLDMLRHELGNENYRKVIKKYLEKYSHQNVESNNLYESIYEVTGRNLDWFFDQWIYRGGEPSLKISRTISQDSLILDIQQTHPHSATVGAFRLPLEVHILDSNLTSRVVPILVDSDTARISIPLAGTKPMLITVDPEAKLLRQISYEPSIQSEIEILRYSPHPMARLEALERLKNIEWESKKGILIDLAHRETSFVVKMELYKQMKSATQSDEANDIFYHGLNDPSNHIRRTALESLSYADTILKPELIKAMDDSSYINIELAVYKLNTLFPDEKSKWIDHIKGMVGVHHNLEIFYLTEWLYQNAHLYTKGDSTFEGHLKQLKYLSSPTFEFRTRIAAISNIMALGVYDLSVVNHLIQGSYSHHYALSGRCRSALAQIKKDNQKLYDQAVDLYPFESYEAKNKWINTIK